MKNKAAGVDDGLERLLDVEERLEARVRAADVEARASVEAARAEVQSTDGKQREEEEAMARAEERADLERHAAELASIVREGAACVTGLRAVPDAEVLRLAHEALALVAGVPS
jgi:hypothetical protein